ncbi:hypothetical protein [Mixta sp. Marseille-Q2659]|uniref:hypothetical protein n=1 Tax=Mixta sp. Marseille-Q2659 TaxID=2736607 RepID=UPI0023B942CC|nr:hypothetical protein [Mixta sp. Marseille-Q2659]
MKYIVLLLSLLLITGCAEINHRYGPHPYGDNGLYQPFYIKSNPYAIYICFTRELKQENYEMETGWPHSDEINAFFIYHHNEEVARFTIDPRYPLNVGILASLDAANKEVFNVGKRVAKRCDA